MVTKKVADVEDVHNATEIHSRRDEDGLGRERTRGFEVKLDEERETGVLRGIWLFCACVEEISQAEIRSHSE